MNRAVPSFFMSEAVRASGIRHRIIGVTMLMAFVLYLDRICMGEIVKSASFLGETGLEKAQIGRILGAFYLSYAVMQIPAGWLSDRFGARSMLTFYIAAWSVCTAWTGMVNGFAGLMVARLLCGVAEAGAYPTSMALVRKWIPLEGRARASGTVAFGGRIGGTLAPFLTIWMIVALGSWRYSLWVDGVLGLLIAAVFWAVTRSSPEEHPGVNDAELRLIGAVKQEAPLRLGELWRVLGACVRNVGLWANALCQTLINIGWGFLVTWLPTYLVEKHGVEPVQGGRMLSGVLALGMLGQIAGGYYCDWTTRRLGLRWGRVAPVMTAVIACAVAYACCPFLESVWGLVVCCALVSFFVDLGNPATWAFMGDIGGRATAVAGGWGNMWGNLGASFGSVLVPWLMARGQDHGTMPVFLTLSGAFALAGLVVIPMDATRRLFPETSELKPEESSQV